MALNINQLAQELKAIASCVQHPICQLYLITGEKNSGKTSLMNQTSLKLRQHISQCDEQTNIWFNDAAIVIELPDSIYQLERRILIQLIKSITTSHTKLIVSGIITCIAYDERFSHQNMTLSKVVAKQVGLSLYHHIVFTKCDRVTGFCEFFDDLHESELNTALGFDVPNRLNADSLAKYSKNKLKDLVDMLSSQVIKKLHKSRNTLKKCLIREFPIQLDYLNQSIPELIKNIQQETIAISGLYFTTAIQGGVVSDGINKSIEHACSLSLPQINQANNNRAYFISGCFDKILTKPPLYTKTRIDSKKITYLSFSLLALICIIGIVHVKSTKILKEAKKELITYSSLNNKSSQLPTAILHLASAAETLKNSSKSHLLPTSKLNTLRQSIENRYTQELHQQYLPMLSSELEEYLTQAGLSPAARYNALKTYQMLGDASILDSEFVMNWFKARWQEIYSTSRVNSQLKLLHRALLLPYQAINTNNDVILSTQSFLNALPSDYLHYSIVLSSVKNQDIPIKAKGFILADDKIPYIYLKSHYAEMINTVIPSQIAALKNESWVLNTPIQSNLTESVKARYHQDYTAWWKKFITRSEPKAFNNYSEAVNVLSELVDSKNEGFIALLDFIQQNTSPFYEKTDSALSFNNHVASSFTTINLMSPSNINGIKNNLSEMLNYFKTLNTTLDNDEIAFDIARNHFQNHSASDPINNLFNQQVPKLLTPWVNKLANNAWFIVIEHAQSYINQKWKTQVYDFYINKIANRYPFASTDSEVALDDFIQFFSDNGKLSKFFNSYIKPFLDTGNASWKPKQINGFIVPIKDDVIIELVRANVIKRMFFAHNSDTISLDFDLQKLTNDPVIATLQLKIGDKQMVDNQTSQNAVQFHWPSQNASVDMYSVDGQHFSIAEQGTWGLFKLLDNFTIGNTDNDNSKLQLLININGNGATYLLNASSKLNPFVPGIMKSFQLNPSIV